MYYRTHRAKLEAAGNLTQQSVEIPAEFLDLIAALVQDSEEPFTILSTRIDDLLSPFLRDEGGKLGFGIYGSICVFTPLFVF